MNGFIGEIRYFAGNFAPRNWAFCNGQLVSIAQNTALFSILGTIYGGDGRTTFALPDMRSRAGTSSGTGPGLPTWREGQKSGTEETYLNILHLPNHNHTATLGGSISYKVYPQENLITEGADGAYPCAQEESVYADSANAKGGALPHSLGISLGYTGNSQGMNNMQPFIVTNYIICMQGTFPSRS